MERFKPRLQRILCLLPLVGSLAAQAQGYNGHPEAERWVQTMQQEGYTEAYLRQVLQQAKKQNSILEAMNRPAEKRLDWGGYRKLFLTQKRIERGVVFWLEHAETLKRAEQVYGVPPEMVVAIIGIETYYGRNTGSYRVLDALATLGFDYPRRAEFFQQQLSDLLRLAKQENKELGLLKGSYAGAMGYGQFIPSSYLNYAVDFDRDGDRDLISSPTDAIGSVANYFASFGWQANQPVVLQAAPSQPLDDSLINTGLVPEDTLSQWQARGVSVPESVASDTPAVLLKMTSGDEADYWLGLNNYYVITRYNRSRLYAMAVYELSQAIKAARLQVEKGA